VRSSLKLTLIPVLFVRQFRFRQIKRRRSGIELTLQIDNRRLQILTPLRRRAGGLKAG